MEEVEPLEQIFTAILQITITIGGAVIISYAMRKYIEKKLVNLNAQK
jgi:hypothetical protein